MLADKYKSNVTVFTDNYQSGELKYLYSHMDYFIATRLHSSIFAIGEGVPSLVIAYHGTKAQGIFHNIDLDEWVVNDYETYSPRQKFYGLKMSLKETGREHTIRIRKRDKEVIKVTEEDRTQCYHNATKELIRRFPIEQKAERVG